MVEAPPRRWYVTHRTSLLRTPPDTNLHNHATSQQQPLHTLKEAAIIAKSIARTPTVATSATRGAWASDDRSRARARHVKKRALDVNRLRRCTDAVMEQLKKAPTTVGGTVLVLCEDENPYVWKVMQAWLWCGVERCRHSTVPHGCSRLALLSGIH